MSRFTRAGAALTGAAAILMAVATPAAAAPATGKVDPGKNTVGFQVNVSGGFDGSIPTSLISLKLSDGTTLGMYCVGIQTEIDEGRNMVERPWDDFPDEQSPFNTNQAKINGVLHNGFPTQSLQAITEALPTPPNDGIDQREAIAATQAAVWHFSDNVDLNLEDPLADDAADEAAEADTVAVYEHLIGDDNTGVEEAPIPSLKIDPADRQGTPGTKIGPFKVSTTATVEQLNVALPDGVRITDADGNELTAEMIKDGTELFVDVPAGTADGEAKIELTTTATVDTGRLFVGEDNDENPTQPLIVAKSENAEIKAEARAAWAADGSPETTTETTSEEAAPTTTSTTEAPEPQASNDDLAETGASVFAPIIIGIVLLGAGIFAVTVIRRRRA